MIRHKLIQSTANELLSSLSISRPYVDVFAIAQSRGVIVVEEPNREGFSGFLFRRGNQPPVIGVNSLHHLVRKRFTVAHELGHLLLHPGRDMHVDEAFVQMRDVKASEGVDEGEMEANRFAAELLMPRQFLEADLAIRKHVYADDEKVIAELARRYVVSAQAMAIRLGTLKMIWM